MSTLASLKELSKAVNAFTTNAVTPLPDDLVETIAAYLRKHQKYDEAASDRLQEELLSIYEKNVKGEPAAAQAAWLGLLRHLLPVLQTPERILQWFDAMKGVLDNATQNKGFVDETTAAFMALITHADEYQDFSESSVVSNPIVERLFQIWMERFYPAMINGSKTMEYNEKMIREALAHFGKRRPKEFFTALNGYFVQKAHRKAALRFFCDFLQNEPIHLHQIHQTPMFANLLLCMQQDTSTTVVAAALTGLVMLLPHMPSSLVPHLPTLFNVYARLLFWTQERTGVMESPSSESDAAKGWDVYSFDPETEDMTLPHLANYYTILYGLYPINFMDYVRKPQRYLRHANAADADDITVQPTEIRHHSEKYRRRHLLHPNFYSLTIDSEKTDFGRWIKSEASEVVADCTSLCLFAEPEASESYSQVTEAQPRPAQDLFGDKDMLSPALLSSPTSRTESWRRPSTARADSTSSRQTISTLVRQESFTSNDARAKEYGADSPTYLSTSSSHTQLQDLIQSNKAIKSSLQLTTTNASVPSLSLSHLETSQNGVPGAAAAGVVAPMSSATAGQVEHLQRQILLLQNDLSFERHLKQRHMEHIGELRRRQLTEAASEAETQNLILLNRNLKNRYEEGKKLEMQVRKESEMSRGRAKKWEADSAAKLKNLRDESKKTKVEMDSLRSQLEKSRTECDSLRRLLCIAEGKELNCDQNKTLIAARSGEADRLRDEVERLTASERDNQAKELEREAAIAAAASARNEIEVLQLKVAACERDVAEARRVYSSQVTDLQEKLADAQQDRQQRAGSRGSVLVDEALAASRAKQAEMQRQHELLLRKYKALQSSLLDMESGTSIGQLRQEAGTSLNRHDGDVSPGTETMPRGNGMGMGLRRGLSAPDGTSFNVTPPLQKPSTPLAENPSSRPNSPLGADFGPFAGLALTDQRYWGRGGVQNRLRKETKDQQRAEGSTSGPRPGSSSGPAIKDKEKEKKRVTGLRGIRGFVQQQ